MREGVTWLVVVSIVHDVPVSSVVSNFTWHPVTVDKMKLFGYKMVKLMLPVEGLFAVNENVYNDANDFALLGLTE